MTNKSLFFHLGRLEIVIKLLERELTSLKEIHKEVSELAEYQTLMKIKHETENERQD